VPPNNAIDALPPSDIIIIQAVDVSLNERGIEPCDDPVLLRRILLLKLLDK
jgi:hypothetical protein